MTGFQTEQLESIDGLSRVCCFHEVGSTNDAAIDYVRDQPLQNENVLFVAERQTAGRGRGSNRWWSGSGGIAFSLLTAPLAQSAHRVPSVSLAVGVALCRVSERFAGVGLAWLKWPNDLFLKTPEGEFKKAAGVLIETVGRSQRLVIGVGINVNTDLSSAPPEIESAATSLAACRQSTGLGVGASEPSAAEFCPTTVLCECCTEILSVIERWKSGDVTLADDWRRYSLLAGKQVCLQTPQGEIAGVCESIDNDGALLVQTKAGLKRCVSGVVQRFS